jgi:hypothetical protein
MQDRPNNYPYNDFSSLKDPNQPGQNSNKQGKKSNHNKYYKQGSNKNNNFDDMNLNNTDHNPNYRHPRYQKSNYQDTGNRNNGPNFKKKKGKKRDNNNDFQYQGNNAIEINQPMKDDYIEQNNNMNLGGGNPHSNIYGKSYKKNQGNIYSNNNLNMNNNVLNNNLNNINMNTSLGSMNSNTNSTGASNISNLNITPQSNNQISPLSFNSNSPLNTKMQQQNVQNNLKNKIYISPTLVSPESIGPKNDDGKGMNLKGDKIGENLSEDNLNLQQGNKLGNNTMNILGNNLNNINNNLNQMELNKNPNDFMNQQDYLNQKYIPQQNNFYIPQYGISGIANIGNTIDNMGNLNNINSMNNINNLNQGTYPNMRNMQPPYTQSPISHIGPSVPNNINNMNQMAGLSFNSFQRQYFDNNNNNKIYPNQIQQNLNYNLPQDDIITHKKIKKNTQNNSPFDQNNHSNPTMNLGIANLNYNGPNNNFIKNQPTNPAIKMNKLSQSSKPPKNTNPFINNDNINIIGNQNQNQNMPSMINLNYGQMNNRNLYLQQNMPVIRNPHMNQGYINNNHINIGNNQIKTDFQNANYNQNMINNKQKFQKYNPNTYLNQKHNNIGNNQLYQKNKNNILNNNDINNPNINLNMTNNKNFGFKSGLEHGNFLGSNKSMDQPKQSFLCLNIKFSDKSTKTINIKKWNESQNILDDLLREGKIKSEREKKLIFEKINKIYELVGKKKIFELRIKPSTYKNLCEIHHKLNYENFNEQKKMIKKKFKVMKKNKSFEKFENIFDDDKKLKLENVRNVGSLNLTF